MTARSDERKEFLAGILTTTVEGGIGYWADIRDYTWGTDEGLHCLEGTGAFATVDVLLAGVWTLVNLDKVAHGIAVVRSRDFQVNHTLRGAILAGDAENDASEIDTEGSGRDSPGRPLRRDRLRIRSSMIETFITFAALMLLAGAPGFARFLTERYLDRL